LSTDLRLTIYFSGFFTIMRLSAKREYTRNEKTEDRERSARQDK